MNEKDAIKAARDLFGSFGMAGRSGRQSTFNLPYVTDGAGRSWFGSTCIAEFELVAIITEALRLSEGTK